MKVLKWLDQNLELTFSSILLVGMVITVCLQIFSRYIFPSPISWTEEVTRYLFVWMVFASIGIAARRGKHIKITLMHSLFPKLDFVFNIFADLCFMLVAALCVYYGWEVVATLKDAGQTSSVLPWLYKWQVYLIAPIGFGLTVFRLCQDVWTNLKEASKKKAKGGA